MKRRKAVLVNAPKVVLARAALQVSVFDIFVD